MAFPQPIPHLPALEGLSVFFQGASVDPGGAHLGLGELSNGLHLMIGSPVVLGVRDVRKLVFGRSGDAPGL